MKYGKLAPTRPLGLKDLDAYLTTPLSAPPSVVKAPRVAHWGMLGNGPDPSVTWTGDGFNNQDGCGDCTKAGEAHAYDALTWDEALGESKHHPSSNDVVSAYFAETGGVDSGLDCGSVLQKAYTQGAFGQKIDGYGPIQYTNLTLLKQLIASFGVAYIGIQCPISAENAFNNNNAVWEYVPGSGNAGGHCIILVGYDDATNIWYGVSWGELVEITTEFLQHYMDEAWGLIAPAIATKGEFHKIDIVALQADLPQIAPNQGTPVVNDSFIDRLEHDLDVVKDEAEKIVTEIADL